MRTVRFSYNLAVSYLQSKLDVYESQEVEPERAHPTVQSPKDRRVTFVIDLQPGCVCLLYVVIQLCLKHPEAELLHVHMKNMAVILLHG